MTGLSFDSGIVITNVPSGNYPLLGANYTGINAYPCPLYIGPGASLGLNNFKLEFRGLVTNAGAIAASGTETLTFKSNVVFTTSGTFTPAQGTVRLGAAGAQSATFNGQPFYNLDIANTNAVTVSDNFTARNLTFPATGANVTFGDGFAVTNLTLAVSGAATLNFAAGKTNTVRNALYLRGASSANRAALTSSGTWYLNALGYYTARQLAVTNSNASGSGKILYAVDSFDGGGNTYWNFANGMLWTGSATTWANAANWSPVQVPASTNVVFIDGSASSQPRLTSATTIAGLSVIGVNGAGTLTVDMPTNLSSWLRVDGDVYVGTNATVTHSAGPANCVALDVGGNLTVAAGGAINVQGCGYQAGSGPYAGSGNYGGVHGGEGGWGAQGGIAGTPTTPTYGWVTNPTTAGGAAGNAYPGNGGGIVIVRAAGLVAVNGVISAKGTYQGNGGGGAGGSVNIRAGQLQGAGVITAAGEIGGGANGGGGGGGGRIAVGLTNGMTFGSVAMSAAGGTNVFLAPTCGGAAAGTIYLQGTNSPYGMLIVSNAVPLSEVSITGSNITTLIGAQVTDAAVVGDVRLQGVGALLKLSNNITLSVYGRWSNAVATNAISGGTVVFAGTDPNPVSVWGGNTWSNLTIATAGMTVQFQAGATQFVYGTPTFENRVTLLSTTPGAYWHLFKPGAGTQDVGKVWVQDSNATNAWTFRASGGANLGHNVNWIFPPSGTVIIFR